MVKTIALFVSLVGLMSAISAIPVDESHDLLSMIPTIPVDKSHDLLSILPTIPVDKSHDLLSEANVDLHQLVSVLMSPNICSEHSVQTEGILDLNKGKEQVAKTAGILKAGALGLATKGLMAAKKGAYVATRIILKPIALITGAHLKVLGTGLAGAGKLVKGTGAGIAKAGTAVKFVGLGSIGLGASAIGWGLDKTTLDTHFHESQQKFNL